MIFMNKRYNTKLKKVCWFDQNFSEPDYKDQKVIERFITERGICRATEEDIRRLRPDSICCGKYKVTQTGRERRFTEWK